MNSLDASVAYRVLLIEDNHDAATLSHHLDVLKKQNMLYEHCESLADGVCRLNQGGIDLILLDLSLPDSQGFETLTTIRQAAPTIQIVVLSGTVDDDIALSSLKYGTEDYQVVDRADASALCRSINYGQTRHRVRAAFERLAAIVEASDDAIIGKTLNGTITSWNKGAEKLFGYSAEEATGRSIAMLFPQDSPEEFRTIQTALSKGDCIRNQDTVRVNKKGERIDVSTTISPIMKEDGTVISVAEIDRDISQRKEAERVLHESTELHRQFVAGVMDYAIFMLDSKGIVESWNEGAKRLKGYEANEIIGKHFSAFYSAEDQQMGKPDTELKIAAAEGRYAEESWRRRKDGSRFFADVVITALKDSDGVLCGFTKVTRDITDRKQSDEEMAEVRLRLSLALKAAEVGVWDLDLLKGTVWRSFRHDQIFGHESSLPEWSYETFLTYVVPEDRLLVGEVFARAIKSGHFETECRIVRTDKAVRWILAQGETLRNEDGVPIRMIGTVVDITDRREKEENHRLMAVMNEREDFMATLTHDMKNPLIGADRLLELFIGGSLGALTNEQSDMLQCLKESNAGVLKLIGNLIEVYRLERDASSLSMTDVDLISLITEAVNRMLPFAKLRTISLTAELPKQMNTVRADSRALNRVLQNLLDNALKFTAVGGTITVRLVSMDERAVIEVQDNGPGIKPEEQARLFQRFSQGEVGKRYAGGSGLGLYLCKQLIEAHGGTIECESKENTATIFRISLMA